MEKDENTFYMSSKVLVLKVREKHDIIIITMQIH